MAFFNLNNDTRLRVCAHCARDTRLPPARLARGTWIAGVYLRVDAGACVYLRLPAGVYLRLPACVYLREDAGIPARARRGVAIPPVTPRLYLYSPLPEFFPIFEFSGQHAIF